MIKLKKLLKVSLVFTVSALLLTGCKTSKQKEIRELSNYVDLSYEGANGSASTLVSFNKDKAYKSINSILKLKNDDEAEISKLNKLLDGFKIDVLNDNKKLKNGDVLKISMEADDNLLKYFRLDLNKKQSVTVAGLKEPVEYDVFEGIDVDYKGYSPNLKVEIKKKDSQNKFADSINYNVLNPPPYYKGQTLKVKARYDKELARKAGYVIKDTVKNIDVPKELGYYVENLSEISSSFIYDKYYEGYDLINKERENIKNFIVSNLGKNSKLKEELSDPKIYIDSDIKINPEDAFFSVSKGNLKTKELEKVGNKLIFIYRVEVTNKNYNFPIFYVTYEVESITKEKDGTFTKVTGKLSSYDKYYDNILIGLANSIDRSYQTYRVESLEDMLKTEEGNNIENRGNKNDDWILKGKRRSLW